MIYNYATAVNFAVVLTILKLASYVVSLILAVLIAILLQRSDAGWSMREWSYARKIAYGRAEDQRWRKIQEKMRKGDEASLKLAVIEANNLFDDILIRMALPGRNMEERLKQISRDELKNIDAVWEARAARNRIMANSRAAVSRVEAEMAVGGIEAALKEWEYLN